MSEIRSRLDSQPEQEGAEFLVLGHLLVEGIVAYKSYTNTRGYDLIAANPQSNRSARIQVKSRWATDAGPFLMRRFDECDFVVLVRLNRGTRYKRSIVGEGKRDPDFYVVPRGYCASSR